MEHLSLRDPGGMGGGVATATDAHRCGAAMGIGAVGGGRPASSSSKPIALLPPAAVRHVREAFGELLATSPSSLILSLGQGSASRSSAGGGGGGMSLAQAAAADERGGGGGSVGRGAAGGGHTPAFFNPVQYEAAMWDAFAQVYSAEVEARIEAAAASASGSAAGGGTTAPVPVPTPPPCPSSAAASSLLPQRDAQLPVEDRRQVLADILVWAEVTRPGYDAAAADFVTGPHASDAAFRRVGEALKRAKEERGLA